MKLPHLVLVGLPGAGKTTVGRAVARRLGRPFLDFDAEIERREGRTIPEIFAAEGESYFRARERALTRELREAPGMVLAPGGGWAATPENVALLRPPARIVYLEASPAVALRRMGKTPASRPLLAGPDPLGVLERLLAERRAAYRAADHVVSTEVSNLQGVITHVVELAGTFGAG